MADKDEKEQYYYALHGGDYSKEYFKAIVVADRPIDWEEWQRLTQQMEDWLNANAADGMARTYGKGGRDRYEEALTAVGANAGLRLLPFEQHTRRLL